MNARWGVWLAVAVGVALAAVALAAAGPAGADHGPEGANYTVEPMSDRSPGATDVKYGQIVVAEAGVDLETLEQTTAVYEEGSWAGCGPGDAEVFGIDRGNTHDGYETDESLQENVKRFSAGEDRFQTEYYGEDDFGPSTHLDDGDALVSVAECIDNPEEPGWYQISGSTTGVTEDGERVTYGGESHYFWICECEDEEEARERLGPPPSEPEAEATPTETETDTETESATPEGDGGTETEGTETDAESGGADDGTGGEAGTDGEATAEPTATPATPAATDDPAPDDGGGTAAATGAEATPTPTPTEAEREWGEVVVRTPSPGDGPGFGGPVALAALAAVGALLRRRTAR